MNKQEAEIERERLLSKQERKFCPLIKGKCNTTCVCLVNEVVEIPTPSGKDSYPYVYCNHSMIVSNWPEV